MSESRRRRAEELFQQAADLPPEERTAFLDRHCGADEGLREEVASLLACLEDRQIVSVDAVNRVDELELEQVGRSIGPYRLLELIGEGGFGSVYLAEQVEPIRRKVALKVIKLGMDTKRVISRFEAERQALALMDHPNIARVLDAGATGSERPFFVMELVEGVPITEFCGAIAAACWPRRPRPRQFWPGSCWPRWGTFRRTQPGPRRRPAPRGPRRSRAR